MVIELELPLRAGPDSGHLGFGRMGPLR